MNNIKTAKDSISKLKKAINKKDINAAGRAIDMILKNPDFSWDECPNKLQHKWKELKTKAEKIVFNVFSK